jgi:ABC-type sugar transport system ATPase subunit
MHILAGDLRPSEGEILVDGKATRFASPLDSRAVGIVVVYQELALCPTMTIAENVVMSDMARRRVASLVLAR